MSTSLSSSTSTKLSFLYTGAFWDHLDSWMRGSRASLAVRILRHNMEKGLRMVLHGLKWLKAICYIDKSPYWHVGRPETRNKNVFEFLFSSEIEFKGFLLLPCIGSFITSGCKLLDVTLQQLLAAAALLSTCRTLFK